MRCVTQTILHDPDNGKFGNCFSAALASLTHVDIDDIPVFNGDNWQEDVNTWLKPFGLAYIQWDTEFIDYLKIHYGITGVHHINNGPTDRFNGDVLHSVVAVDGKQVFDPHPSRSGLVKTTSFGIFIAIEPWRFTKGL